MFLRLLFLLLLILNVGVAAWLVFGSSQPTPVPATDKGVAELQLISEREGASVQAEGRPSGPPRSPAQRASDRCLSIGPFDTQAQTRDAINALGVHVSRIQFRQQQVTQSHGWWVYLPAVKSHEQALSAARALSANDVRDYYVITAGDQQNTVSLGLYNQQANARRRMDQLQALGFEPQMKQRVDSTPVYQVDIALPASVGFDWRGYVHDADVQAKPIACF